MLLALSSLGLLAALTFPGPTRQSTAPSERFPASSAVAQGVSPESLADLGRLVQSLVDEQEIVGAELLVIKNGHSILHEAYGWRDREAQVPMEPGSVFCVRSMTKPVVGAAILMLIDDDLLELDDRAAKFLPAFDVDGSREITIEQLLTHTGGLPMSLILGKDLNELEGIQAVAALGGGYELEFEPGSAFNYSDQGTDTLTALVEVVSGMPVADFVHTRVLEPLGMHESACVMTEGNPLRERGCCKYVGSPGSWTRFWSPEDAPLFPFFLGSQGLYSTLEDYARFMDFWLSKGRAGKEKLLGSRFVRKALTPGPYPLGSPTGLPGLRTDYGYLMQLWTGPDARDPEEREVVAFGHTGSDGTHAWVFPDEKAMVLYFTQSRNNSTGLRLEEVLGDLFLGVPYDPNQAAPPFEDYLGYYWEGEGDLYRAIVRDGEDLALEVMGKGVVPLTYVGEDRWKLRPNPATVLAFERSDTGEVTGYSIGDHREFRFEPSAELPSVEELVTRVRETYRLDLLETLGPVRLESALNIEKIGITGETTAVFAWPDRFRYDSVANGQTESVAFDGEQVRSFSSTRPLETLEGARAATLRVDTPLARLGDWRLWYPSVQVIQRLDWADGIIVVRAGDTSAPARTLYVELSSGRIAREDSFAHIEGMGRTAQRLTFEDFREVSGILLPHRTEIQYAANPLIGTIVTTLEDIEFGVELPEGTFALQE